MIPEGSTNTRKTCDLHLNLTTPSRRRCTIPVCLSIQCLCFSTWRAGGSRAGPPRCPGRRHAWCELKLNFSIKFNQEVTAPDIQLKSTWRAGGWRAGPSRCQVDAVQGVNLSSVVKIESKIYGIKIKSTRSKHHIQMITYISEAPGGLAGGRPDLRDAQVGAGGGRVEQRADRRRRRSPHLQGQAVNVPSLKNTLTDAAAAPHQPLRQNLRALLGEGSCAAELVLCLRTAASAGGFRPESHCPDT